MKLTLDSNQRFVLAQVLVMGGADLFGSNVGALHEVTSAILPPGTIDLTSGSAAYLLMILRGMRFLPSGAMALHDLITALERGNLTPKGGKVSSP